MYEFQNIHITDVIAEYSTNTKGIKITTGIWFVVKASGSNQNACIFGTSDCCLCDVFDVAVSMKILLGWHLSL